MIHEDRGHGGADSGAVYGGVKEKDINLDIGKNFTKSLEKQGIKYSSTRTTDKTVSNGVRVQMVRNSKNKYCISNHVNSFKHNEGSGWEIWVSQYSNQKLAKEILKEFANLGLDVTRGVKTRKLKDGSDYYFMHRNTGNVETLIIEHGFITSDKDRAYITKAENRVKLANAITKAICKVEGLPYISPDDSKNDSNTNVSDTMFRVVTGSFRERKNAEIRISELKSLGYDSFIDIYRE